MDAQYALRHGIEHSDVLKSYLGLSCLGKNDFEAVNGIDSDPGYRLRWEFKWEEYIHAGMLPHEDGGGPVHLTWIHLTWVHLTWRNET